MTDEEEMVETRVVLQVQIRQQGVRNRRVGRCCNEMIQEAKAPKKTTRTQAPTQTMQACSAFSRVEVVAAPGSTSPGGTRCFTAPRMKLCRVSPCSVFSAAERDLSGNIARCFESKQSGRLAGWESCRLRVNVPLNLTKVFGHLLFHSRPRRQISTTPRIK